MKIDIIPKGLLLLFLAAAGAAWLAAGPSASSYQDQLLKVAVRQSFGDAAAQIAAQPPQIQALLLEYADNQPLVLKTRAALLRYPELTRRLLPIYGAQPEFQEVLLTYGEGALPPIGYFMDHDLDSLKVRRVLGEGGDEVRRIAAWLVGNPAETAVPAPALTPEARGWYAIDFLREDGYGFLSQFAVTPDGKADWVQSARVLDGLNDILLGGVRGLETKWRLGHEIQGADLGWAALDVVVIAGSVKLVKALRAAKVAAPGVVEARAGGRAALIGSRVLARGGRLGVSVARYGALPAAAYLMIRYPSLLNASLAQLAGWLGIAPWVVQFSFWFVGLSLALRLALLLLGPLSRALRGLGWVTGVFAAWFRPACGHRI